MLTINSLIYSPRQGHDSPLQDSCLENPHGQRSLVVYSPWSRKELDMTKQKTHSPIKWGQLILKLKKDGWQDNLPEGCNTFPSVTGSLGHMQLKSFHLDPVTELYNLEVREDRATAFI